MRVNGLEQHAERACRTRDLDPSAVLAIVRDRLQDVDDDRARFGAAVVLGRLREARGALVGSNGDLVVAIVRGDLVRTVMLRRSDQPLSAGALRVSLVVTW